MFCPKCGQRTTSSRCDHCGHDLQRYCQPYSGKDTYVDGHGNAMIDLTNNYVICGNCSRKVDPDESYCPWCGKSVRWQSLKYKIKSFFRK